MYKNLALLKDEIESGNKIEFHVALFKNKMELKIKHENLLHHGLDKDTFLNTIEKYEYLEYCQDIHDKATVIIEPIPDKYNNIIIEDKYNHHNYLSLFVLTISDINIEDYFDSIIIYFIKDDKIYPITIFGIRTLFLYKNKNFKLATKVNY